VVFPQARFLTPSAVSADPIDPPFMQTFENLKIYNLYDRAFPFVTFAHRLQRPSTGLRGDPLRQMSLFSKKFWSCYSWSMLIVMSAHRLRTANAPELEAYALQQGPDERILHNELEEERGKTGGFKIST